MAKTLFEVWTEHVQKGTCSSEFNDWCAFRAYCSKTNKRAEDFADAKTLVKPEKKTEPKTDAKIKAESEQPARSSASSGKTKGV